MKISILIIPIMFLCQLINAQVDDSKIFPLVVKQLQISPKEIHQNLYTEKKLPFDSTKTVVVIPKFENSNMDTYSWDGFSLRGYILIVESATGRILQKYIEENTWESDAIQLSSIHIDTGLFYLNEKQRAFGVRISYRGSSGPNPYGEQTLSLYVPKSSTLDKVLVDHPMSVSKADWDTRCEGSGTQDITTINFDKKQNSNGFRNIILKTITTYTKSYLKNNECISKETQKSSTKSLIFNGKIYQ